MVDGNKICGMWHVACTVAITNSNASVHEAGGGVRSTFNTYQLG